MGFHSAFKGLNGMPPPKKAHRGHEGKLVQFKHGFGWT